MTSKVTVTHLQRMKERGEKIAVVTCYDYASALLLEHAGVDVFLVGDSLGNVVLGHDTTIPVTLDDMVHHTRAARRGTHRALLVADMPFMTYQVSAEDALRSAGRLMQEAGAEAVKLEGGAPVAATVRRLVEAGIPVMGHLGLTPQSVHQLGGYRVQGRDQASAQRLLDDARALVDAGAFAMVLELVPIALAATITGAVAVPTIGIGAGPHCDGQVQVFHDLFGLFPDQELRHVKRYAEAGSTIRDAAAAFAADVRSGRFPPAQNGK